MVKQKFNYWVILILFLSFLSCQQRSKEARLEIKKILHEKIYQKAKMKSAEAKAFCVSKNLNTDFFIFIDMEAHSGLKRFLIWDFKADTIADSFMVSHGCCNNIWGGTRSKENATVSNVINSHCSSIGKYIIGDRGYSQWGIHVKYLLHGMESTNNNALKRVIVLHSWEAVSDEVTYPKGTPEGWGCPAVSNNALRIIDQKLRNSPKKVLMWAVQ
jgi:hypothetical protein